jgi:hypothetical protein
MIIHNNTKQINKLRGFSPQANYYRPSDRRLSAKLVPTLADRGYHVVSATNPPGLEKERQTRTSQFLSKHQMGQGRKLLWNVL